MSKNKQEFPKSKFWELRNQLNDGDSAELLIYGVIGDDAWFDDVGSKQFANDMQSVRGRDVTVRINSYGGGVFAGQAMYSALKQHDKKVTVVIDGIAASIASVVAMAGDEVIMPENAMMMIHNPWSVAVGESKDMRKAADELDRIRETLVPAYEGKTNLSRDEIIEMMDEETWFTSSEAKEKGFIDTVEVAQDMAASIRDGKVFLNGVSFGVDKFKNLPSALLAAPATEKEQVSKTKNAGIQKASKTEDVMDIDSIKNQHPDLFKQIMDAGIQEGVTKGAEQERKRIQDIEDMAMPGHEELVSKAKFETGETAAELAVNIVKAEKSRGSKFLNERASDASEVEKVSQSEPEMVSESSEADEKRATWRNVAKRTSEKKRK